MAHVYVTLARTGTYFARFIRLMTGDWYSHAAIAFDSSLDTMYSFGRKTRYNVLNCGFIEENVDRGVYKDFDGADFCVLEVEVTPEEYCLMRAEVDSFLARREVFGYNLLGLTTFFTGIPVGKGEKYFCSQFVSHVLSKASWWHFDPKLTKPMDFFKIPNKRIVYQGTLGEFRSKPRAKKLDTLIPNT